MLRDDEGKRNRLVNFVLKVLSVCNPVNIFDLEEALKRSASFRNSSHSSYNKDHDSQITFPPNEIILEKFRRNDRYVVDANFIGSKEEFNYKDFFGNVEIGIIECLASSPTGVMSRNEILKNCIDAGLNEHSVNINISYSPAVTHVGIETYKLIGKSVDSTTIAAHQQSLSDIVNIKRLLLCEWEDGMIKFVIRCPQFTTNFVIGSPSYVKSLLMNKKFQAISFLDKQPCGTIAVNEAGSIYGMGAFCTSQDIKEDDILVMKFDLLSNDVYMIKSSIEQYIALND
tara:strand:- start:96 stop:950 length:855 start_codon:yes stop_codon:yes gene_type:complete